MFVRLFVCFEADDAVMRVASHADVLRGEERVTSQRTSASEAIMRVPDFHLPPMWPGFLSSPVPYVGRVFFVGSRLAPWIFLRVLSFLPPLKQHFKLQFDQDRGPT